MATAEQAIDAIRATGGAQPGKRALHAKGRLYRGSFTATPEAATLCRAAHLAGAAVPALIRFSSGSGNPRQPDNAPGVRGMAVKFTLPDGSTTDVSTQTAKLFPASTPDGFVSLLRAMRPGRTAALRLIGYIATHPRFLKALPVVCAPPTKCLPATAPSATTVCTRSAGPPPTAASVSCATTCSRWSARSSCRQTSRKDRVLTSCPPNSTNALRRNQFDSTTRSRSPRTATRPSTRPHPGTATTSSLSAPFEITGVETKREHDGDIVVFDPMRITDGIEASDDPVLRFRTLAYSASVKLRTGVDRGPEAPAT